jgi:hypothetical protein
MDDSGIQHKQTFAAAPGFGFDDAGERVQVVMPQEPPGDETNEPGGNEDASRLGIVETFRWILEGRERCGAVFEEGRSEASKYFEQLGRRFYLFAYVNRLPGVPQSNNDLAAAFEVSAGGASQMVKKVEGIRKGAYAATRQKGTGFTVIRVGGDANEAH